jgi:hypothetical protein
MWIFVEARLLADDGMLTNMDRGHDLLISITFEN